MNISHDLELMLAESGWTQDRLAKESGVHFVTLSRLRKRLAEEEDKSALSKILPFVYGDKRPPARAESPPATSPATPPEVGA